MRELAVLVTLLATDPAAIPPPPEPKPPELPEPPRVEPPPAKPVRKAPAPRRAEDAARTGDRPFGTPPALTASALRAELRQAGGETAPRSDRARLEALAADIARAREALRQDTARLEALLQRTGGEGELGEPLRMPIGDPLAPAAPGTAGAEVSKGQVDTVSRAMKGMKPEQAAAIVSRLHRVLAAEILRRMRPADAGAVLGQLKPELAAELATEIATRPPRFDAAKEKSKP